MSKGEMEKRDGVMGSVWLSKAQRDEREKNGGGNVIKTHTESD